MYAVVNDYSGSATRSGAYVLTQWRRNVALTLAPGVRADHWALTDDSTTSPWMQAEWHVRPRSHRARRRRALPASSPTSKRCSARWGRTTPRARSGREQYDLGVEQRDSGATMRWQLTVYDREEQDLHAPPGAEHASVGGRVVRGVGSTLRDALDGYARGVEFMVQRTQLDAALSGWLWYAYGRNRYRRHRDRRNVLGRSRSAPHDERLRALPARIAHQLLGQAARRQQLAGARLFLPTGNGFLVTSERNGVRLPSYARLDLRANRTFNWSHRRLTLFAEVINVLNRDNVRYRPPSIDTPDRQGRPNVRVVDSVCPSAGVLIEF